MAKQRVLFIAEAATLAHVARPLALSRSLDAARYDLFFACAARCDWLLQDFRGQRLGIESVDSAHFLAALARGKPLYTEEILERYVRDDLAVLETVAPDVVVGDFRLSLSVSARLARIPYVTISNCYWSPYWTPARYPVPNLPLTRALPLPLASVLFRMARPVAFSLHCRPLNRVRQRHGLPSLGSDLRRIYTDADWTLYADLPELFPDASLPTGHSFLGPVAWNPPLPEPAWWRQIPPARQIVYLTLGSSGPAALLPEAVRALAGLEIELIVATAGARLAGSIPPNVHVADYLPGSEAARRSRLVVCNGGSPTSLQALAAGVPVIGIADNLDQHLNMSAIVRVGAGASMRSERFAGDRLRALTAQLLTDDHYRRAASRLAEACTRHDAGRCFRKTIDTLLTGAP